MNEEKIRKIAMKEKEKQKKLWEKDHVKGKCSTFKEQSAYRSVYGRKARYKKNDGAVRLLCVFVPLVFASIFLAWKYSLDIPIVNEIRQIIVGK
ncbi:hypothetical protein GHK79_04710 [Enterococcus faecium]|uniref:hypothetical protein n=1 Tax=Enterococcus faecium TaxID=1352 RepID=UPI00192281AC|nr:hypothetical protein [Enterococcus faecium]EHK9937511.1 hypothetical protein [Enterococcus faecium]EMF0116008.1 hypothetical protein [Enterococcus hirae]MBL3707128.1 hypothetical protein [Enterococcus faecium]